MSLVRKGKINSMAVAGDGSDQSLEHTPTWALATVCFIIISVSLFIEHAIHLLSNWLKRHKKIALFGAVEKLKSELMLLGFISLFLVVTQDYITKICIPANIADIMLPCRKEDASDEDQEDSAVAEDSCSAKGKVALVSEDAIHQLHIFIFVLAAMQIVFSTVTMALGRAKTRRWKAWEKETQTTDYLVANDPHRFRFTRQTTFGRRHMNDYTEIAAHLWIKCFFRQFFKSVAKVDYLTLRHGFIAAHLSTMHNSFNFQQYIERSLDEDFSIVVGISPLMWFIVVILLLLDVHGWYVYSWLSYVPVLIVLAVGTKLEIIVARMALQIKQQNSVTIGTPLVKPNDDLFWFGKPNFVLTLLHYILFVNAYELAFTVWITVQFGVDSCYHVQTAIVVARVVIAVMVQVVCSYITLPLYALVTQMGSEFKSKVVEEQVGGIIKRWLAEVRERRKQQEAEQPLQSARPSNLSPEWSSRFPSSTSATEVHPFIRKKPCVVEITEEQEQEEQEERQIQRQSREAVTQEASSSYSRGPHQRVKVEIGVKRGDQS